MATSSVNASEASAKLTQESKEEPLAQQEPLANHPLSLSWSFGFNSSLPVHNVSDESRKMVFYVSSHVGVLLDCTANKQTLLQGHAHSITCTAVSGNRRWAVTGDVGPDSSFIVWDTFTGVPVCTQFDGLGGGCVALAMSQDAKYVATLSASTPQVLSVWEWTSGENTPKCHSTLSVDYGQQTHVMFHPDQPAQLVSNSEDTVVFYHWTDSTLTVQSTPLTDKDFNKPTGSFRQTVFIPGSEQAVTGTSEGCAVVWVCRSTEDGGGRKPEKLIKIHDTHVTVVTTVDSLVVTGDSAGTIKFFDATLKLLHWYENRELYGHLVSLSFAHDPPSKVLPNRHLYPSDATLSALPFCTPDFSTSSITAIITHTTANGTITETLLDEHDSAVTAVTSHPSLPRLVIGSYSSKLKLWDYEEKLALTTRHFKSGSFIECVTFDPKGEIIGVGLSDGRVWLVDGITLEELRPSFHYSRDSVTIIKFSHDSLYMATADTDCCVTVYVCCEGEWGFLAKHRSHHKHIQGLLFGVQLDSTLTRLLSLGLDRNIVEYDLVRSSEDDLRILSCERVEQDATPLSLSWYPPLVKESFILVSNDQYKLKLFNSTTMMCRQTLLGPTFGSPIARMLILPAPIKRGSDGEELRRYLAYVTENKVGLMLLPHNGNPHNSSCLLAHPSKVTDLCASCDGRYVFTAGGDDHTVNMWATNTDALEALSLLGGSDLEPFYSLLEGGRQGEFFKELEEFFYYAQMRSQGVASSAVRDVSTSVPVEQVPDIMRAVGYYPSEEEIDNMLNEVKFREYVDSKVIKTDINLGDFLKLYVNYRPAFGLSPAQFEEAFKLLGQRSGSSQNWSVHRAKLLELLQEKGEHLTEVELVECLMTLMGASDNPEVEGSYIEEPGTVLAELPTQVTAASFAEDLLGLTT